MVSSSCHQSLADHNGIECLTKVSVSVILRLYAVSAVWGIFILECTFRRYHKFFSPFSDGLSLLADEVRGTESPQVCREPWLYSRKPLYTE